MIRFGVNTFGGYTRTLQVTSKQGNPKEELSNPFNTDNADQGLKLNRSVFYLLIYLFIYL